MNEIILGLATGIIFGALLQVGGVVRFEKQVGAMLLKDMTIFKFMLSAIIVGMIGINGLADLGVIDLKVKGLALGPNLLGGLIFGLGWAIAGYCPGTALGAVGEGRWHAIWALLGMVAGAALYAEAYPIMKKTVLTWGVYGKLTLAQHLDVNHWLLIAGFTVVFCGMFWLFEKMKI